MSQTPTPSPEATPNDKSDAEAAAKSLFAADHLRYARLWLWLGILMITTVVVLSLIDTPQAVKSAFTKDKFIHCFVYACLMGWFAQIFRHHVVRLLLVVLFIAMGVGVEFIQGLLPARRLEFMDIVANTSGVILAWILSYTWVGRILAWFERSCLRKLNFSS